MDSDPRAERPVSITCHDHVHHYELAWRDTPDGPVITDLRITSTDGSPITKRTLSRIDPDRLAVYAAGADSMDARVRARELREVFEATAKHHGLPAEGYEDLEEVRFTKAGVWQAFRESESPPRVGRPPLTMDHYQRVAALVLSPEGQKAKSVAEFIRKRMPYADGDEPSREVVYDWIKGCKTRGLLAADAVRKPKRPNNKGTDSPL
ncbi:roadblock/LC7 domain-containing protein [Nocardia sp. PE-7]|uniref:roadblock/LC7 domain-containing protein n=1 Tax=Nocardia sp. PE-7 TaxID=3058426 RepID=UPI00265A6CCB|nr:roadblock/LC7 domain-containing protein [Nocardia sp. PE-7]WKG08186.1 roadblock/LC7 domain-containing protein [Nocardia sp. PE-7]